MTNFRHILFDKEPWMKHGACRGLPSEWFFIAPGDDGREGKAVCQICPVEKMCLNYALDPANGIVSGLWGKTTARERDIIKGVRRLE